MGSKTKKREDGRRGEKLLLGPGVRQDRDEENMRKPRRKEVMEHGLSKNSPKNIQLVLGISKISCFQLWQLKFVVEFFPSEST